MRVSAWCFLGLWAATAIVLCPARAAAQATRATVIVRVVDSSGAGVGGADVALLRGLTERRAAGTTDSAGRVTLRDVALEPETDYELVARKIGYDRAEQFFRRARDTLRLELTVRRHVAELTPIVVTAEQDLKRKSYHVGADDIAASTKTLLDATDVLAKMRPDMICGRDCNPSASLMARARNPVRACPGLVFQQPPRTRCPVSDAPPSLETNVWVNGRRIRMVVPNEMAVARQHGVLAGLSPASMTVLSEIKPEHIAEITYVDQFDTSIGKLGAQGGLFVVLKPGVVYEEGKGTLVVAGSDGAPPPAQPAELPAYRYRLLGVFDAETGEPIAGADVVDMTTGTRARTTVTGTVSLVFLPEGGTPVRIVKPGYEDLTLAVEISAEHRDPLTLIMTKAAPPAPKPPAR